MTSKIAVVAAYAWMILSNVAAARGVYGGSISDLSAASPTYVTPDGLTFAIWGVIFLLQLGLVIAQCCETLPYAEMLLSVVRWRIALAFFLLGLWCPVYISGMVGLSFIIILGTLLTLFSIYIVVNPKTTSTFLQYILYVAPISTCASWLLVATTVSFFSLAGEYGWKDEYGVCGTVNAAILAVILVTVVGSLKAILMTDLAWSLAAAWALRGIYRMQTVAGESFPTEAMNSTLANWANVGVIVVLVASEIGLLLSCWRAYQNVQAPQPVPYGQPALLPQV